MSRSYAKSRRAPLGDRCVAYLIDSCIAAMFSWVIGLGCIYWVIRDGIRDGRSIGKGMMNLRVVKHGTNRGASVTDSCLRNCCNLCVCLLCVTSERRHFGDYIGGTVVLRDR